LANRIPMRSSVVSGVVLRGAGAGTRMLLLERSPDGFWCHVAGKVEEGELAWEAFLRELLEETGLAPDSLHSGEFLEQFYEPRQNLIEIIPVFVARVAPDAEVSLNEEHSAFRWCALEEAKALVPFPNQRAVYEHVWANHVEREPSEHSRIALP